MRFNLCCGAMLGLLGLLLVAGCQPAEPSTEGADALPTEQWLVLYLGGDRIGHGSTTRKEVEQQGHTLLHTRSEQELHLLRFGEETRSIVVTESLQTLEGQLVSFRSEMASSGASMSAEGVVEHVGHGAKLMITTGSNEQIMLAWSPEFRGPFALEETLMEDPLEPGETRQFMAIVPMMNQVANYQLEAVDYETIELLEGEAELLRVESQFTIPGKAPIVMTLWADRAGEVIKSHMAGIDQTTYAVSRAVAEAETAAPQFDLGEMTVAKIDRPLVNPHRSQRIVYRVHLAEGDPANTFMMGESQAVEVIDEHTAQITVRALRAGRGEPGDGEEEGFVPSDPPNATDREPNSLIQSDDAGVVALAESIAPREEDPWRLALALEQGVEGAISEKNYSQTFASAAEVAESREGDCTEHAVLLAALCRARGLPARVAIGLVYYPAEQGYAYHMWNEVWIEGRWIPLDATLGRGGIGAAHLKIAESSLEGSTAYSTFLPVLQVMGQLELEVVSAE